MRIQFENSNQSRRDMNTARSSNLVEKIRYDYRESASREPVAAKAISDCLKTFQGESTQKFLTLVRDEVCFLFEQQT